MVPIHATASSCSTRGCVSDAIKEQRGDEAITELMTVLSKAIRK